MSAYALLMVAEVGSDEYGDPFVKLTGSKSSVKLVAGSLYRMVRVAPHDEDGRALVKPPETTDTPPNDNT